MLACKRGNPTIHRKENSLKHSLWRLDELRVCRAFGMAELQFRRRGIVETNEAVIGGGVTESRLLRFVSSAHESRAVAHFPMFIEPEAKEDIAMQMKHTRNITLSRIFKRIYQSTKTLSPRKRMFGFAASLLLAAAFFSSTVLSSGGAQVGIAGRLTSLTNRATHTVAGWFGAPLSGTITGQVYRDFNADGADDGADEPGVGGVTVTAYDSAGVNQGTATTYAFNCIAAGNPDASCTGLGTPALGSYSLSAGGTGPYRIEFTNLPTDAYSGPVGAGSATSVQFVADGNSSNVNFGINNPIDYSQANPKLVTPCYTNGDAANATVTNTDALVSLNYDGTGAVGHLVPTGQIGATWGVAWNRYNRQLFVSAVIRRHSSFGPQGIGGLYAFNISAGGTTATAAWSLDLNTLAGINVGSVTSRDLTTLTAPSVDADAFTKVGKAGIGDIDLEEDGKTLWLVNMKDGAQSLIKINVANASPAPTGATNYPLSGIAGVPTCTNGVFRPWGLKFRNRQGYLAGVCSAESVGGVRANMTASVLRFDPANPAAGFTTVLGPIQLNYPRLQAYPGLFGSFRPWTDTMTPILASGELPTPATGTSSRQFSYPTPVFCDIEFDNDGSMILGFLDRSGLQFGANNWDPRGAGVQMVYHTTAGELLRAFNNNGTFQIENNGQVGPLTTSGPLLNSGPGGKEFYWGEEFPHPGEEHRETSFGGLALVPGKPDIALTLMDPSDLDSGGLGWLSNTNGSSVRKSQIYQGGNSSNGTYGKSIGLGDLEALSDPAPIEIGNRLWMDTNSNGRQDPGEMGLSGVTVKLFNAANAEIGSVATDANGNYLFSSAAGIDAAGRDYNVNGLTANADNFGSLILAVKVSPILWFKQTGDSPPSPSRFVGTSAPG